MKKKAVMVSGYLNPIHKGHLEYFNDALAVAYELFVNVNNDHQRALNGSNEFQGDEERIIILSTIKALYQAIFSVDEDCIDSATLEKIATKIEINTSYLLPIPAIKTKKSYQNVQCMKKWVRAD